MQELLLCSPRIFIVNLALLVLTFLFCCYDLYLVYCILIQFSFSMMETILNLSFKWMRVWSVNSCLSLYYCSENVWIKSAGTLGNFYISQLPYPVWEQLPVCVDHHSQRSKQGSFLGVCGVLTLLLYEDEIVSFILLINSLKKLMKEFKEESK